jgi:hypothetical protein
MWARSRGEELAYRFTSITKQLIHQQVFAITRKLILGTVRDAKKANQSE